MFENWEKEYFEEHEEEHTEQEWEQAEYIKLKTNAW